MSIGDGIFAGAALLACVALYIAAKDRWNWKKLILWPLGIIVVLGSAVAGWVWIRDYYDQRAQVQTQFWDIALGDTVNDLRFKKGPPKPDDAKDKAKDKPVDKTRDKDKDSLRYRPDDSTEVVVSLRDGKVRSAYAISSARNLRI
jgi:hypothetical protein